MVGVANNTRSFAIVQAQMEPKLVSIIWNSMISAIKGGWRYSPDIQNCPLYCRCPLTRVSLYYVNVSGINRVGTGCKIQDEFSVINFTKTNTDNC